MERFYSSGDNQLYDDNYTLNFIMLLLPLFSLYSLSRTWIAKKPVINNSTTNYQLITDEKNDMRKFKYK
jgi:hypothetical protein